VWATRVYDTENNLTDIYDANNNHTQFTYTNRHQLQQTTFPSGYYETYTFDYNDNLRFKTDRNGHQISYTYDFQNRLAIKTYPDYTTVNYTYDAAGRLTQVADPTGTYSFGYDNMGRLTSATSNYAFTTFGNEMVQYAYDKASNRTSLTDPQNLVPTAYAYDKLNRLASITLNNDPSPDFTFAYDALSRRTSLNRANAITTTYAYNPQSWLTSVLHKNSAGTILDGAAYTYDNAGNRKTRTDKRLGTTLTYGYDNIYQLLTAKQGTTTKESYTYDIVGNRLSSLGVSPYNYNSSNELTSLPSGSYTYDKNGNTTVKPDGTQYTWDYENRLAQVVLPGSGGTANFKYDPFGRRIQKAFTQGSGTTTTNYLYDGKDLLEELDNAGNVLGRYTPGPRVDQPLAELRASVNSYYEQDALGSTTSLTDTNGVLANTYTYDSFGKVTASTGTISNPAQYTGRELDLESGAYFYRARFYDQNVGRFLSEDPIGFKGGINFYAYVNNRPTKYRDPLGLLRDCDEEHIECNRRCQQAPVGCLPWPVGRYGSPAVRRWSRTAYCTAKCLEEYMACNAENEARQLAEYCSSNPVGCAALITASVVIVAQPELGPVLVPVIF
jgi:RHS repeat-associated protein